MENFYANHPGLGEYDLVIAEDGTEGFTQQAIHETQLDKKTVRDAIDKILALYRTFSLQPVDELNKAMLEVHNTAIKNLEQLKEDLKL